jgi:hypothetical protein
MPPSLLEECQSCHGNLTASLSLSNPAIPRFPSHQRVIQDKPTRHSAIMTHPQEPVPCGRACPLWESLSLVGEPVPCGRACPLWESLSLVGEPVPCGRACPLRKTDGWVANPDSKGRVDETRTDRMGHRLLATTPGEKGARDNHEGWSRPDRVGTSGIDRGGVGQWMRGRPER